MNMRKTSSLALSVILILSALFVFDSAPASSADEKMYKWKLFAPVNYSEWMCRELRDTVMPAVYEATNGRLKIDMFVGGEHPYDRADMLKAVRDGMAEMAYSSANYMSGTEPHLAAFELPMIMPGDFESTFKIYKATFDEVYKPTLDRWGVREVMTFVWPNQRLAADVAVKDWDSLRGKKIRVWSKELSDFIKTLNGTPITMAFGEVPTALATGVINGVVTNSGAMYDLGVFDSVKTLNLLEIQYGLPWLVVSKTALAKLPDDVQKAFLDTMRKYQDYIIKGGLDDANSKALQAVNKYGVTITSWSKDFREEVVKACKESVWKAWAERAGPEGQKALAAIEKAKAALK